MMAAAADGSQSPDQQLQMQANQMVPNTENAQAQQPVAAQQ